MGTIFVAYGTPDQRRPVLSFAAEQAAASGHELFVYHIHEEEDQSADHIRNEIERVINCIDPDIPFRVQINTPDSQSDLTTTSKRTRLLDAIFESSTDYEYVVMGDIERDAIEGLTHASLTKAVLKKHAIPVVLVPV